MVDGKKINKTNLAVHEDGNRKASTVEVDFECPKELHDPIFLCEYQIPLVINMLAFL